MEQSFTTNMRWQKVTSTFKLGKRCLSSLQMVLITPSPYSKIPSHKSVVQNTDTM